MNMNKCESLTVSTNISSYSRNVAIDAKAERTQIYINVRTNEMILLTRGTSMQETASRGMCGSVCMPMLKGDTLLSIKEGWVHE